MWLSAVRDGAIILLAVESLVIGVLLVILLWQLWRLVRLLEREIKPLLDSANETVNTMRSTTSFVSENVVSPVVRLHSFVAGVRGGFRALLRRKPAGLEKQREAQSEKPAEAEEAQ